MEYNEILKTLQDYYSNLLIVQYNGKPKAKATIEKLVNLIYANMILLQIEYAFDWKTAEGEQLDIIGKWVGVNRSYNIPALQGRTLLAYPQTDRLYPTLNTSAKQHGYVTYPIEAYIVTGATDFTAGWLSLTDGGSALTPENGVSYKIMSAGQYNDKIYVWDEDDVNDKHYKELVEGGILRYSDMSAVDKILSDDEFRIVIGLKIIYNSINHTVGEIDEAIWKYFGGVSLYTRQNTILNGITLYNDKEFTQKYGVITNIDNGAITVNNDKVFYNNVQYELSNTDISQWTKQMTNLPYYNENGKEYGWGGLLVADSKIYTFATVRIDNFTSEQYVSSSVDGITWEAPQKITNPHLSSGLSNIFNIYAYGNDTFVVISTKGYVSTSTDGQDWTVPIQNSDLGSHSWIALTHDGTQFIALGKTGYISTSIDGETWTPASQNSDLTGTNYSWEKLLYANGEYIATGVKSNSYGLVATSSDCINWTVNVIWLRTYLQPNLFSESLGKFIYFNGDSGIIYTSDDCITWNNQPNNLNSISSNYTDKIIEKDNCFIVYKKDFKEKNIFICISNGIYQQIFNNVYTTWQPHQVTYHYPSELETVMDYCKCKKVLPAPMGVNIQLTQY